MVCKHVRLLRSVLFYAETLRTNSVIAKRIVVVFGPIAVGYLLFVWGLMPTSDALIASGGYFIFDRALNWLNQNAIKKDLLPQKEELARAWQSLNEVVELSSVSDTTTAFHADLWPR